jgi:RNA polymerase sigma-70 factor (ECF subfamily)
MRPGFEVSSDSAARHSEGDCATAVFECGELDGSGDQFLTDEQLLIEYRETGERERFNELVDRYQRELYNYLRRYLGDAEAAEDVFQAAFLQVHLKRDQFEEGRRFRPWLYTVATNQAIDHQRRTRRHRMVSLDHVKGDPNAELNGKLVDLLVSDDVDPLAQASDQERGEWVQEAVDRLSDQMRLVVQLVYYRGLKYREAAEVLSIPVGTVKSRLHAAVSKLSEIWNETHTESN